MAARRPEHEAPPELYYTGDTARRYARNTRLHDIQNRMTLRALELLALPAGEPCLLLDIGCGTGLSGATLRKAGHTWIGADISREMLLIAKQAEFDAAEGPSAEDSDEEDEDATSSGGSGSDDAASASGSEQDEEEHADGEAEEAAGAFAYTEVAEADMGAGLPFRPGSFDGAVSISAIQWLCVASKRTDVPQRRLKAFFQTLYNSLRRGARAVLQFYPENQQQTDMIVMSAMKCGFGGGLVVDYPHSTRARKFYLVIYAGHAPAGYKPPAPLMGDEGDAVGTGYSDDDDADGQYGGKGGEVRRKVRVYGNEQRSQFKRRRTDDTARPETGSKQWVLLKKAERRSRGDATTQDSKYTMRRRKPRF
jgi:18S rRNA (guanine1575-N7)-methyltransferase